MATQACCSGRPVHVKTLVVERGETKLTHALAVPGVSKIKHDSIVAAQIERLRVNSELHIPEGDWNPTADQAAEEYGLSSYPYLHSSEPGMMQAISRDQAKLAPDYIDDKSQQPSPSILVCRLRFLVIHSFFGSLPSFILFLPAFMPFPNPLRI